MAADDQDLQEPDDPTELVKHLRGLLKKRDDRVAEGEAAKRELAFVRAGVDTSSKLGQLFAKSFEGDVNDIEAIKAEAKELGLIKDPAPTPDPTPDAADNTPTDTSAQERSSLANGATADDHSGTDPRQDALAKSEEALKKGARFEEAAGSFIAELAKAALNGDQRVVVAPNR